MIRSLFLAALAVAPLTSFAAEPCPHPYFPLEEGLELKYRAGKTELTARYSEAKHDKQTDQAKLTLRLDAKNKEGSTVASCTKDGIATDAGGLGVVALQTTGMDVKVTESTGILLPGADTLKTTPWTNTVAVEMSPPSTVKMPLGMKPIIRSRFKTESSFVAEEKVTTAAGTFDAIKVKTKTTAIAGATGAERSLESFLWFAEGVGLVKVQTGDRVDLELIGLTRPAEAKLTKPAK